MKYPERLLLKLSEGTLARLDVVSGGRLFLGRGVPGRGFVVLVASVRMLGPFWIVCLAGHGR